MKLVLSNEDISDLILQRTGPFGKLGGSAALLRWMETGERTQLAQHLIAINGVSVFVNAVMTEITAEFEELRPYIAALNPTTLVSIGPGMGFFEMLAYKINQPNLVLIDIEQSVEHQHAFHQKGSGYSRLGACKDFLASNGVAAHSIACCNPRKEPLPNTKFDVLISLLSMGFHYPCDEYAAFIRDQLRPGGRFIFDKRTGAPDAGWDSLQPFFDVVAAIPAPKSTRFVLSRKET